MGEGALPKPAKIPGDWGFRDTQEVHVVDTESITVQGFADCSVAVDVTVVLTWRSRACRWGMLDAGEGGATCVTINPL